MNKLEHTKELIRCWVDSWGGENVYVADSGGKDSTVLRHIVRSMFPDVVSVFSNTGLEFPEIVRFVKSLDNVEIVRPKKSFKQVVDTYGWPVISKDTAMAISRYRNTKREDQKWYRLFGRRPYGDFRRNRDGSRKTAGVIAKKWLFMTKAPFGISEACCQHLKKSPLKAYEKRTGRKPMLGIMASDSLIRRRDIDSRGCNVYDAEAPQSRPLAHWTEDDVWAYIRENNVPYCGIYDKGYDRTGCIFCMFGLQQEIKKQGHNRFLKLEETHPKLHDYVIHKLGGKEVLEFMGLPYTGKTDTNPSMEVPQMLETEIKKLTAALEANTAALLGGGSVPAAAPPAAAPPAAAPPAAAPPAAAPPAAAPPAAAPPAAAPPAEGGPTIEDVRARLAKVIETQGPAIVPPALAAFGVQQLTQLDPSKYQALLDSVGA